MSVTRVRVGDAYDVVIGTRLLGALPDVVGSGVERVLVVHARALAATAEAIRRDLMAHGVSVLLAEVPDGEQAKSAAVASSLWTTLGQAGFTRSDAVVGFGGGAVTDLAGFVAATWLRGIRVVQVPTTLLAMVDAAVGGKTGINTAEGKNLVGAFHPPAGVLCDLDLLGTLPRRDLVAGLAEVIKCGFIDDPAILDLVEDDPAAATVADGPVVRELVERAVAVKARIVTADLRESSLREVLNYGHTFAHAIELVEGYRWRHGDAVSVGMVYAAELARLAGTLDDATADRHARILASVGLPVRCRGGTWPQLYEAMKRDKKARGSLLRFVVLTGIAEPTRLEGPSPALLEAAYTRVSTAS